jgi:hypothetical protein
MIIAVNPKIKGKPKGKNVHKVCLGGFWGLD